jgi:diacylglycerol kinase family enzyme
VRQLTPKPCDQVAAARWYRRRLADPAGGQFLRIVGDGAQHRDRASPPQPGHDVQIVETNRRGHATRFAHDAARRGLDVVIGFGGDGTLNEVATGIAGTDTALGVLPGGSTNVFARTLGLPNDPVEAADHLANGIDAADLRPIGLGR